MIIFTKRNKHTSFHTANKRQYPAEVRGHIHPMYKEHITFCVQGINTILCKIEEFSSSFSSAVKGSLRSVNGK